MTPHPQAEILRAIADGEELEQSCAIQPWWGAVRTSTVLLWIYHNPTRDCTPYFRIKPKTININGIEVPEPMREEPKKGTQVWVADLMNAGEVTCTSWYSGVAHKDYLKNGLCHLTEEAAIIHANALLSFTRRI